MRIANALVTDTPAYSFEFFPPKSDEGVEKLLATARFLRSLNPLFVSVTYGAGGSTRRRTIEVAQRIKREVGIEVLVHVTCVGSTHYELRALFDELAESGIENILALRGDPPAGETRFTAVADGFSYALELITLLKKHYSFCIGAACYPEKHIEADDAESDLAYLKQKVDAGAEFLISQLFFDNAKFLVFLDRARAAGIDVPIMPGIMPITEATQVKKFTELCGATIPTPLLSELERRIGDAQGVADLGVAFAALQCVDLLECGAAGLHFYTLNKSTATRAVVSSLLASRRLVTGRAPIR